MLADIECWDAARLQKMCFDYKLPVSGSRTRCWQISSAGTPLACKRCASITSCRCQAAEPDAGRYRVLGRRSLAKDVLRLQVAGVRQQNQMLADIECWDAARLQKMCFDYKLP